MKEKRAKRTKRIEYDRSRGTYKQSGAPPKRQEEPDDGPHGPRSYAVGQVSQDYGETRRESAPVERDDGLHQQPARRRRQKREARTAIGPLGEMTAGGD